MPKRLAYRKIPIMTCGMRMGPPPDESIEPGA